MGHTNIFGSVESCGYNC